MTNFEVARQRLAAHHISTGLLASPAEVVRNMGALQAQDYQASLWAIGLRAGKAKLADIDRAVEKYEIVRTWPMRGTLHWIPGEDLRWMVALMAPRAMAKSAARRRQLEIDEHVLSTARTVLEWRLREGGGITRPEAYALLAENGVSPDGQRGIHILQCLAHEGSLCLGPHRGKQPTFVLVDRWLPSASAKPRDEALAELARRYFSGHGPATVHDFAWWTGLTVAEARQGLEGVHAKLASALIEGREYWHRPGLPGESARDAVHLLPAFDEFILGYTDRTAVLAPEQAKRIFPGANGMFLAAVVSGDGEVVGTWRRTLARGEVRVTQETFGPARSPLPAFEQAARRYAEFLGLSATGF